MTEVLEGPEGPEGPDALQPEPAAEPAVPAEPGGPVLAVFGHPDDAEIAAGGTMSRWVAEGREVHLLVLTNGDRGSEDRTRDRAELARTREAETQAAARLLGLASAKVLGVHAGELQYTPEVRAEIARAVRAVKPTTVLTCDPTAWFFGNPTNSSNHSRDYFNHSDHRTAGAATLDAVFPGAGNPLFFEHLLRDEGLEPWSVPEVWLAWTNEPNHHQDITGFMERKLVALAAHASQVQGGLIGFFEDWLPREAEANGRKIGVQHAEAFRALRLG